MADLLPLSRIRLYDTALDIADRLAAQESYAEAGYMIRLRRLAISANHWDLSHYVERALQASSAGAEPLVREWDALLHSDGVWPKDQA